MNCNNFGFTEDRQNTANCCSNKKGLNIKEASLQDKPISVFAKENSDIGLISVSNSENDTSSFNL